MRPVARFLAPLRGPSVAGVITPWRSGRPLTARSTNYLAVERSGLPVQILRWLGLQAQVHGLSITSPVFGIAVRRGCDGIEPAWIFSAAVIAFPNPLRRKLAIVPVGIILILALNLVRIVSLFYIGWRLPLFFSFAHLELWPAAFLVLIMVMWIRWARTPSIEARSNGHA